MRDRRGDAGRDAVCVCACNVLRVPHYLTAAGLVWYAWFEGSVLPELRAQDPEMVEGLTGFARSAPQPEKSAASTRGSRSGVAEQTSGKRVVPYRAFLRSKEMQALMVTHFCNNWWVPHV